MKFCRSAPGKSGRNLRPETAPALASGAAAITFVDAHDPEETAAAIRLYAGTEHIDGIPADLEKGFAAVTKTDFRRNFSWRIFTHPPTS